MTSISEAFVEKFAGDLAGATTAKAKIIAERNAAVASCIVALEEHRPEAARSIFERELAQAGTSPTGAIDLDDWHGSIRTINAEIYPTAGKDNILATICSGNAYHDVSVASHPASGNSKLFY
jgi:hypothetical protein